ncbi:MAG: DNA polymerase III subunit gamma/tau [Candidatus Pacebacteria bacterium]|nr:DNA polymerase III subunit gamma/tau [Candidatus Paceibacterota bacterium]
MSELVLYRKYRPAAFADVVGQDHVITALQGALKEKNVAHAYLFYGSRGTGKTSVARIFAGALGARDSDVHEIDAATYTGVDNIRALREEAAVMPFESERKVYIVDEVHMLSKGAFNAFLKLLEEPPSHVTFILATTELEKVPDTIQSRCQVFTFKKPTAKAIAETVIKIAKSEGYVLDKAAGELVALLADGSFRDSQSVLQKVLSASADKKITVDEVAAITGAPRTEVVQRIMSGLSTGSAADALGAVGDAVKANADIAVLLMILIDRMRMLLMLRYAPALGAEMIADLADIEQTFLTELAKDAKSKINSETLRKLLVANIETARSPVPQLPLELAIMELAQS